MKFSRKRLQEGEYPTTRDGRKVLDIYDTYVNTEYCMVAWIEGTSYPFFYTKDGKAAPNIDSPTDLVHPTQTREARVVLYYSADEFNVYSMTEAECHMDTLDEFIEEARRVGRLVKVLTVMIEE